MQLRVSFGPTEELMARAMGDEEGRKWPQMHRWNPNSTEGAPNGKSGLNAFFVTNAVNHLVGDDASRAG